MHKTIKFLFTTYWGIAIYFWVIAGVLFLLATYNADWYSWIQYVAGGLFIFMILHVIVLSAYDELIRSIVEMFRGSSERE